MSNTSTQSIVRILRLAGLVTILGLPWSTGLAQTLLGPPVKPITRPDLSIDRLSLSRGVAHLNETVEATVNIKNDGPIGVKNVTVRFFLGENQIGRDYLVDIRGNALVEVSTEFRASPRGKLEFIVMLDPDNVIAERRERNNIASRTLGILSLPKAMSNDEPATEKSEPAKIKTQKDKPQIKTAKDLTKPKPTPKAKAKPSPKTKILTPKKSPANLVGHIETIEGLYYFDGKKIRLEVSNTSKKGQAHPFMLGIRPLKKPAQWLVKLPVKGLKPGESTSVEIPWPTSAASGKDGPQYVAVVDMDNDVDEGGGEKDNISAPFKPIPLPVTASKSNSNGPPVTPKPEFKPTPKPKASLIISAPSKNQILSVGHTIGIRWKINGNMGNQVQIIAVNALSNRETVIAITANSGRYDWIVPNTTPEKFSLRIRTTDNQVQTTRGPFTVAKSIPKKMHITSPKRGDSLQAGRTYTVRWDNGKHSINQGRAKLVLYEAVTRMPSSIPESPEFDIDTESISWTLPKKTQHFGNYTLALHNGAGQIIAESDIFEISPNYAKARYSVVDDEEAEVQVTADLAVTALGFKNDQLNFTVENLGPDTIPAHVSPGVRIKVYFIKELPVTEPDDYQICDQRIIGAYTPGKKFTFNMGEDAGCDFGSLDESEIFKFAVVRIEIPPIHDAIINDMDYTNNLWKISYPH
ncbi:MAG: hypothetical protein GXP09_08405 [Gammaproteobacteria bacterium]|nr:hypothetical protein [Gammaproteobacteria bacterium]